MTGLIKKGMSFAFLAFLCVPPLKGASSGPRPKVGLVLGGGGIKGLAHVPVLKCLDDLEFPVDYIAGTSAGGIVGALYASGYSGRDIESLLSTLDWGDLLDDRPPRRLQPFLEKEAEGRYQLDFFPGKGMPRLPQALISGEKLFLLFSRLTFPFAGERDFGRLPIPFCCTAVDIVTGKLILLKSGSLARAMRATMAIPGIFTPVDWDDYLLIDGGTLDNLPVDAVKEMGAEIIIAVDLSSPLDKKSDLTSADKVVSQSMTSVYLRQQEGNLKRVDLLIHPDMKNLGGLDFFSPDKLARISRNGEAAARESVPKLKSLKEKYRLDRSKAAEAMFLREGRQEENLLSGKIQVGTVTVSGNTNLPQAFIIGQLGIKQGDIVEAQRLNQRVMSLYALGYFETIHFEILPGRENRAELKLLVKEYPRIRFGLGLRYDNLHNLVAAVAANFVNLPFPGLRIENELAAAGLTRYRTRISYPSLSLSLPVYPLFHLGYKSIPTRFYGRDGDLLIEYRDASRSVGAGLGLLLGKSFQAEISYQAEAMGVKTIGNPGNAMTFQGLDNNLRYLSVSGTLDTLDDVYLPREGLLIGLHYEGSYKSLATDAPYESFEASLDFYKTVSQKHTLRLYGYGGTSSGEIPFYKLLNQGRPSSFVGMKYDQLLGNKMKIVRGEYRYAVNHFVHLKAMGNLCFGLEQRSPEGSYAPEYLWGVGAGVTVYSPAGPLELIASLGSKSFLEPRALQGVVYFSLGAKF